MKIVIAGGTGFLGRPLTDALVSDGHTVVHLSRQGGAPGHPVRRVGWKPDGSTGPWASEIDGADVIINLASESIGPRRWSPARKRRIVDSRVLSTRSLVAGVGAAAAPPALFLSSSGAGYYGPLDDRIATEETPAGHDFLATVCATSEDEATRAASARTRVVCARGGLILARHGGALAPMLLAFRFGVGGPVGSGRQYWPWIHLQDWIDMIRFTIATPAVVGPLNVTGPEPVTNKEFAKALGRAIHRPAFMPAPAFALRLLFGELADGFLLSGQRAVPAKAQRLGYKFKFETLHAALANLFP